MKYKSFESIKSELKEVSIKAIKDEFGIEINEQTIEYQLPPQNITAHIAIPCFKIAKAVKKSPNIIAQKIANAYEKLNYFEKIDIKGPYLNVSFKNEILFSLLIEQILKEKDKYGEKNIGAGKKILIEYSSPNTNKPLHLGHVRNNVLGMSVSNLFEKMGYQVLRICLFNDRGIHIAKAMVAYKNFSKGETPQSTGKKGDHFVGDYYVLFEQKVKEQPELMEQAREMLRKWEAGDEETVQLWKKLNSWVYEGFWQTYNRMGCKFDVLQYESETYLLGKNLVQEGLKKGVFYRKEDGSVWANLKDIGLDEKVILRSDGTTVYITQDLGTAVDRFNKYHFEKLIYVVASEQNYHFQVLFELLRRLGFKWADKCFHLSYGMVYLPEGKMKSREGKVVDADDLMDEMKNLAKNMMRKSQIQYTEEELDRISEIIGQGAIKYFILKVNPKKDIYFNPEESLSFEGNTGAYIQYAHARICSILRKAGDLIKVKPDYSLLGQTQEVELAKKLLFFSEILKESTYNYNPSILANYLYQLARQFNLFYRENPVIKAEPKQLASARLKLCQAVQTVLKSGLNILTIEAPEKM